MNKKLLLKISKALLLARWKQTLVAAMGVTFSIAMFISLLGFMGGLNNLLDGLMLNRTPHIRLYNDIKPSTQQPIELSKRFKQNYNFISSVKPKRKQLNIYNSAAIIRSLKNDSRIKGVASKIATQVFFNVGVVDLNGVINGIDVDAESELAGSHGVMSIPTVVLFKDGKEVGRQVGFAGKAGYVQLLSKAGIN